MFRYKPHIHDLQKSRADQEAGGEELILRYTQPSLKLLFCEGGLTVQVWSVEDIYL